MRLLSEQKRKQLEDDLEQQIGNHAFDAIERAILAKLAGAELPEPDKLKMLVIGLNHSYENVGERSFTEEGFYTAACEIFKLCQDQAYAQGAAAQLAEKPTAFIGISGTIWKTEQRAAKASYSTPLYTRKEPK